MIKKEDMMFGLWMVLLAMAMLITICARLAHGQTPVRDDQGWTVIPPAKLTFYVDAVNGKDTNSGTDTTHPVKTCAAIAKKVDDGDAVLWKVNTVMQHGYGWLSKKNVHLGAYGDLQHNARPKFQLTDGEIFVHCNADGMLLTDLIISNTQAGKGVQIEADNCLVEGCYIYGWFQGLVILKAENTTIRRCAIARNYLPKGSSGHAQGVYADYAKNLIIDSNVIAYNGWDGKNYDTADMFSHGLYIDDDGTPTYPIILRNNIIAENGGWGVEGRPGGLADDNFIMDNGLHGGGIFMGGASSEIRFNVVTSAVNRPMKTESRGSGLYFDAVSGSFHDNIVLHARGPVVEALGLGDTASNTLPTSNGTVSIHDNIVGDWSGDGFLFAKIRGRVDFFNNAISSTRETVNYRIPPTKFVAHNNVYGKGSNFRGSVGFMDLSQWVKLTKDLPAAAPSGPANGVCIEAYAKSIGLASDAEVLLGWALSQKKTVYSTKYEAQAVNFFFRKALNHTQP